MDAASLKRYTSSHKRQCKFCKVSYNIKGISTHEKACAKKQETRKKDIEYERSLLDKQRTGLRENVIDQRESVENLTRMAPMSAFDSENPSVNDLDESFTNYLSEEAQHELRVDDIRTDYHPYSGRQTEIKHFEDYDSSVKLPNNRLPDEKPWLPFRTRTDFDFAEVAFKAALSAEQTETLIKIINDVASGLKKFTLVSNKDLTDTWARASTLLTPFKETSFKAPYKDEEREFKMHYRPLWDWTLDLLNDEQLSHHFVWDAQRLYKYDGKNFVRFYHEPWTGDRFWEIQNSLGTNGSPLAYILYCDKSNLSSFGTEKGYPVVVRLANLPVAIRNGEGIGGGRVVGWLPTNFEDPEEEGKPGYTQLKRVVWHEAMSIFLQSIEALSKVGFWFVCADGIKRRLFPCIMALSADYEEQCFMALIRGPKGKAACPICLVPSVELSDLSKTYALRTTASHKEAIDPKKYETLAKREEKLMDMGLRPVENVFWKIANSDPYYALSWDRLHAYHGGLFAHHLWRVIREEAENLGRAAVSKINALFDSIPRWQGLYHTDKVMAVTFSDGSKLEDISKQLLYAAHSVLEESAAGYALLRCLRSYLVLDMYLSLEVHTEETLAAGEEELLRFSSLIKEYAELSANGKNWDFPKMHTQKHAFDDIRAKGVTRNYNTKTNEKLHGPIKDSYHLRTNFKNVAKQILNADHICFTSLLIRSYIDDFDEYERGLMADKDDMTDPTPEKTTTARLPLSFHHTLGSIQRPSILISSLEEKSSEDIAFKDFRKNLCKFLTDFLPEHGIDLPKDITFPIKLDAYKKIIEYRFLKVNYESKVTWRQVTDLLRCSPKFHNAPRYDSVLIQTVNRQIFAQLIFVFSITIGNVKYPLALVQPFDAPVSRDQKQKDQDFGLFRVCARTRRSPEIFPVSSIIRGAVLVKDDSMENDYLVMDIVDGDMFLRVQELWG